MNDEVHAAWNVTKGHRSRPSAFVSQDSGPIGEVIEGRFHPTSTAKRTVWPVFAADIEAADVAILKAGLGDDGRLVAALDGLGYRGAVIEAMGAGHFHADFADRVAELAERIPVILSSRVPGGAILTNTYGFKGSEMDLIKRGLIPSGRLCAVKSRILLAFLCGKQADRREIAEAFVSVGLYSPSENTK